MFACEKGHTEVACLLLEAGADKDLATESGHTALTLSRDNGHLEIARSLQEAGADEDLS